MKTTTTNLKVENKTKKLNLDQMQEETKGLGISLWSLWKWGSCI